MIFQQLRKPGVYVTVTLRNGVQFSGYPQKYEEAGQLVLGGWEGHGDRSILDASEIVAVTLPEGQ